MPNDPIPVCQDEQQRRADVLANPALNGIDYLEVDPVDHSVLQVFFLKPVPPLNAANPADPDDAFGLSTDLTRTVVTGGTRIVGLRTVSVTRQADGHLEVRLTGGGDFSIYPLTMSAPGLDPILRSVQFSFMAGCPVDIDCRQEAVCPPVVAAEPALDYQAKDYASFPAADAGSGPAAESGLDRAQSRGFGDRADRGVGLYRRSALVLSGRGCE